MSSKMQLMGDGPDVPKVPELHLYPVASLCCHLRGYPQITVLENKEMNGAQGSQVSQRQRQRRHTRKNQEGHQDAKSSGRLHQEKGRVDDRREGAENSSPVSDLTSSKIMSMEKITELLQAHSKKVITPSYRRIFISRVDVWTTAFRYFHQDSFARHHGLLMVSFACDLHAFEMEPPDCGGPRREFFRRLIKAIFEDSGAFEESPTGFIPKLNASHLENGVYRTIGRMMSTIMIQGGEPPARLAPCVVDYILTGDVLQVNATPDDVSASELREMLKKVETSSTERELEDAVKRCDSWRFEVEGLPNPVNMNTKDTLVKKAALFHVILKSQACLDQLIDGLSYYEVLPLFRENPSMHIFLDMPKVKKEFTADDIAGMFKPRYSELHSRFGQEAMVLKFLEFLEYIQGDVSEDESSSDEDSDSNHDAPGSTSATARRTQQKWKTVQQQNSAKDIPV
ncbi:G2E3 ligase, partial [Polypterus senegalus]